MNSRVNAGRRDFLKTGALAGAGLVIGFYWPSRTGDASTDKLINGAFAPNAFLQVDPEGHVTIWKTMPEMGQGVHTSLPMLVAEELEVEWSKVRFQQADFDPKYGGQAAGGSASVRESWAPLRQAGATAREMLITAAAQKWGVDRAACRAEKGMIIHQPSGRRIGYGELVETAAKLPAPQSAPLKDPKDFRLIGTRAKRSEVQLTKLAPEAVTVHVTLLGGGFGRRAYRDYAVQAIQISQAVGAPVKLLWSREDDMRHDRYHPAALFTVSAGLDTDGRIVAWKNRMVAPSIGGQAGAERTKNGMDEWAIWGAAALPYDIPNVYVDFVMANTGIPIGAWRSMSEFNHAFAQECFIDEIAAVVRKDPYELRLELLSNAKAKDEINPARLKAVLEKSAAEAGWGRPLPKGQGRGIAAFHSYGSYVAEVAEVSISANGAVRVNRVVCAIDCGMTVNPDTIEAQMQSAIVYGLTAALKKGVTIDKGRAQQSNFHDNPMLRISEMPGIEVHIIPSKEKSGGVGEPGTPPIAPAVANAIFAATGSRIRRLPIQLLA